MALVSFWGLIQLGWGGLWFWGLGFRVYDFRVQGFEATAS